MLIKFEQKRKVRTTRNFEILTKAGFQKNIFDKALTPCSWNKYLMLRYYLNTTIFQCRNNYGSPTRVTRLKVAPNMADPISLKDSDRCLNKQCWSESGLGLKTQWVSPSLDSSPDLDSTLADSDKDSNSTSVDSDSSAVDSDSGLMDSDSDSIRWTRTHSESRWVRWEMYKVILNFNVQ